MTKRKGLGIGFGDLFGHAKPCFDCFCQLKRCPGPRFALTPLTRLNWRELPYRSRLSEAVTARKAVALTASNRPYTIEAKLWDRHSLHQS
jgi:hypothetical protein